MPLRILNLATDRIQGEALNLDFAPARATPGKNVAGAYRDDIYVAIRPEFRTIKGGASRDRNHANLGEDAPYLRQYRRSVVVGHLDRRQSTAHEQSRLKGGPFLLTNGVFRKNELRSSDVPLTFLAQRPDMRVRRNLPFYGKYVNRT